MKTVTLNLYTASELKERHPDGFKRALSNWQNRRSEIFWQAEIFESLKATVEAAGLTLKDWNLGAYNRGNFIKVKFPNEDVEELSGKRAFAWLENNLFGPMRISYRARNRWELAKYNGSYRSCHPAGSPVLQSYCAGHVPPCPLTGYCADEDYLDALRASVRKGETLKEAFEGLADVYARLLEAEAEYQVSEEYFIEHAEANEWNFTEEGELE